QVLEFQLGLLRRVRARRGSAVMRVLGQAAFRCPSLYEGPGCRQDTSLVRLHRGPPRIGTVMLSLDGRRGAAPCDRRLFFLERVAKDLLVVANDDVAVGVGGVGPSDGAEFTAACTGCGRLDDLRPADFLVSGGR